MREKSYNAYRRSYGTNNFGYANYYRTTSPSALSAPTPNGRTPDPHCHG